MKIWEVSGVHNEQKRAEIALREAQIELTAREAALNSLQAELSEAKEKADSLEKSSVEDRYHLTHLSDELSACESLMSRVEEESSISGNP